MKYFFFALFLLLPFKNFSQTSQPIDTLYIKSSNSVVIIHPTNDETTSLANADTTNNFRQTISDYGYNTSKLIGYLHKNKITYIESDANFFVLKDKNVCVLKRKDLIELLGYIYINSKGEYKIIRGAKTDTELIDTAKSFLNGK
jgi:hypothetical protein